MMHPHYLRSRRKIRTVGSLAIATGVVGLVFPFIPGVVLLVAGISVLSLQSHSLYQFVAMLRSRHPSISRMAHKVESRIVELFNLTTHSHEYYDIPRRDGATLSVLVELSPVHAGVAVLMHSASGTKETPLMHSFAEALRARGLTVVRFDAYYGLGESGGSIEHFTGTSMYEDLEDVLVWARTQEWWIDDLTHAGHSIGGLVAAQYAIRHTHAVRELILLAPMTSGDAFIRTVRSIDPDGLEKWRAEGSKTVMHPLTDEPYDFPYGFVKDACQYDLLRDAHHLTMPVHILVGSRDRTTLEADCKALAHAIGEHATITTLTGLTHNPKRRKDIAKFYHAVVTWKHRDTTHHHTV